MGTDMPGSGCVRTTPNVVLAFWPLVAAPDDIAVRHSEAAQTTTTGFGSLYTAKETTMNKKIIGGLAAAVATTGIAVATPGLAHADDTDATIAAINAAAQFTQDVTNAGFYNSGGASAQLLIGITACNRLDDGWTPAAEAKDLYENTSLNAFGSGRFVGIAMRDLCPWHIGQGFLQSAPRVANPATGSVV